MSICGYERQHSRCGAVVGSHSSGAVEQRIIRGFHFHATDLWRLGSESGNCAGDVDRVRFRVFADARLFARALRGSFGRQLLQSVRACAPAAPVSVCFTAGVGRRGPAVCFFSLADVIAALVVIRILLQFLVQAIGVIVLRIRRPDLPRPFRMWLYPLPALIASFGFVFILISRKNFLREIRYAAVILIAGLLIYFIRAWRNRDWPFGQTLPAAVSEVPTN